LLIRQNEVAPDVHLLVIDDDEPFVDVLLAGLSAEGHEVRAATTLAQGLEALREDTDLLLLDLAVASEDGMEVLRTLRRQGRTIPVIIMTGTRMETEDTVLGLEEGADDYIHKPFALSELLARIHAVMRRHRAGTEAVCAAGNLKVDRLHRIVTCKGREVEVTLRELELLALLTRDAGRQVSRASILDQVWRDSPRSATLDNTLDVHISRLRKKLEDAECRCAIDTVRGKGFKLTVEDA
jgi:DNA-binding response OmpR family regulator